MFFGLWKRMGCGLIYFWDSSEPLLNLNRQITIYIKRKLLPLCSCRPNTESFSNHFRLHVNLCPVVATKKWCQNIVCKNIAWTIHLTFLNTTKEGIRMTPGRHLLCLTWKKVAESIESVIVIGCNDNLIIFFIVNYSYCVSIDISYRFGTCIPSVLTCNNNKCISTTCWVCKQS